jgi:hypothetical protein
MIEIFKNQILSEDYKIKNSVLLEMLENNKHDKAFITQMEQAKPETRELINSLISTMELPQKVLKFVHPNFVQLPRRIDTSSFSDSTPKSAIDYVLKPDKSKVQMLIAKRKESFQDLRDELMTSTPNENIQKFQKQIDSQMAKMKAKNSGLLFMQNIFTQVNNSIEELTDSSDQSVDDGVNSAKPRNNAVQKLRQFVAKNFLSISLS